MRNTRHWVAAITMLSVLVCGLLVSDGLSTAFGDDKSKKSEAPNARQMKTLVVQAIRALDEDGLRKALQKLARVPGREPAKVILSVANGLSPDEEHWYWLLLEGACTSRRPEAYSEIGDYICRQKKKAIARDLMHALGQNHSKYVNRVIRRVLERGSKDLQMMALDLAQNIPVRRTVDVLMPVYAEEDEECRKKGRNSDLKLKLIATLEVLTRRDFGDSLPNWQSWWMANRDKGLAKLREEGAGESKTGVIKLDPLREREWVGMEDLPGGRVLVIKGATSKSGVDTNYDHIEHMLERLKVKHDVVLKDRLVEPGFSLKKYAAVFINCTQINPFCQSEGHQGGDAVGNRLRECLGPAPHDTFKGKMKPEAVEKIRKWVLKGGFLFTEDWALMEVLEPAFPKFVRAGEVMERDSVGIRAARGKTSHYILRGVFVPPISVDDYDWMEEDDEDDEDDPYDPATEDDEGDTDAKRGRTDAPAAPEEESGEVGEVEVKTISHKWTVDNESRTIHVHDKKKVQVLIVSNDLKKKYGDPAVAVAYSPGKGHVVHMLSHFGKQSSRHDEATLENILVNFLLKVRVKVLEGS